jgi:hypothetical protein
MLLKHERIDFSAVLQHHIYEMIVWKQKLCLLLFGALIALGLPAIALAAQTSSTNYQVNEAFFGSGGELNACSSQYCSKQSAGDLAVGQTASSNFQAQAGFNTDRNAFIEIKVNATNINLGTLTTNSTATAQASFSVKSYLSHGYTVVTASDPPTNNSYQMAPITTLESPITGKEQFGINLVANSNSLGADPVQSPDNTFAYGSINTEYATPDFFHYQKGETVAHSDKSSSDTTYTISYIFNISNVTPGGGYVFHHVLVATATF